jgi:hypothetical protein
LVSVVLPGITSPKPGANVRPPMIYPGCELGLTVNDLIVRVVSVLDLAIVARYGSTCTTVADPEVCRVLKVTAEILLRTSIIR